MYRGGEGCKVSQGEKYGKVNSKIQRKVKSKIQRKVNSPHPSAHGPGGRVGHPSLVVFLAANMATTKSKARNGSEAPGKYDPVSAERVAEILAILQRTYPGAVCALHHENAWQLLVATILSAQCTDVRVNLVTPALFKKYPTAARLAKVEPEDLEELIRSTGFFRNKAKSIVGAARLVTEVAASSQPS